MIAPVFIHHTILMQALTKTLTDTNLDFRNPFQKSFLGGAKKVCTISYPIGRDILFFFILLFIAQKIKKPTHKLYRCKLKIVSIFQTFLYYWRSGDNNGRWNMNMGRLTRQNVFLVPSVFLPTIQSCRTATLQLSTQIESKIN